MNTVIAEAEGREGVKPLPDALDLFRRQAGMERQRLFTRGAIQEYKLHRLSLLEGTAGSLDALAGLVRRDPEEALLALDAGQFDDRIDELTRERLKERATRRRETLALDAEDKTRRDGVLATQAKEKQSFAFRSAFRR